MRCWTDEPPPPRFPWVVFAAGVFVGAGLIGLAVVAAHLR